MGVTIGEQQTWHNIEQIARHLNRIANCMEAAEKRAREQEELNGLLETDHTAPNAVTDWRKEVARGATNLGFTDWMAWYAEKRKDEKS
jgi:predicted component of type VI protein secretion system